MYVFYNDMKDATDSPYGPFESHGRIFMYLFRSMFLRFFREIRRKTIAEPAIETASSAPIHSDDESEIRGRSKKKLGQWWRAATVTGLDGDGPRRWQVPTVTSPDDRWWRSRSFLRTKSSDKKKNTGKDGNLGSWAKVTSLNRYINKYI